MSPERRRLILVVVATLGSSVVLWLLLASLPDAALLTSVVDRWRHLALRPLLLAVAAYAAVVATHVLRLRVIARPTNHIGARDAYAAVTVAGLINLGLPARLGDLYKVRRLSRSREVPKALAVVLLDGAVWLAAFCAVSLAFGAGAFGESLPKLLGLAAAGGALLVAAIIIARRSARVRRALQEAAAALPRPTGLALAATLGVLSWLGELAVVAALGAAFGLELSTTQAWLVVAAVTVGLSVPAAAGLGVWELSAVVALGAASVVAADALAFAILYHVFYLAMGVLATVAALVGRRRI